MNRTSRITAVLESVSSCTDSARYQSYSASLFAGVWPETVFPQMDIVAPEVGPISYEDRLLIIEQQELETAQGRLLPEVYCEFLALYLLQGDYNNCKLLWRRIPQDIKTDFAELAAVWNVCKAFGKRDFAGVFQLCDGFTWSDIPHRIMLDLKSRHKQKCLDLICKAYSEITTETAASLLGISTQACLEMAAQNGWRISEDSKTISPIRKQVGEATPMDNASHLQKLTQYISFLET